jgi:hypothetical protein
LNLNRLVFPDTIRKKSAYKIQFEVVFEACLAPASNNAKPSLEKSLEHLRIRFVERNSSSGNNLRFHKVPFVLGTVKDPTNEGAKSGHYPQLFLFFKKCFLVELNRNGAIQR